ncbi:uncharacterized protein LOC125500781 [Athalia rosae]|uniref:uncharacterized protein LOC125500781 n=1 Tax=Athalia rosae TaxID=37344 RepID=UPI002033B6E9|nr:uncharacterized protein LOC125500781 [Athalia rosae]
MGEGERIAACVGMDQCVNDGCLTRTAKLLLVARVAGTTFNVFHSRLAENHLGEPPLDKLRDSLADRYPKRGRSRFLRRRIRPHRKSAAWNVTKETGIRKVFDNIG